MKRFTGFIIPVVLLALAAVVFAADPAATVAAAPVAKVSIIDWFKQNSPAVFAALFAISEVLGLIPGFRGNGIFDTIVKALAILSNKQIPPAEVQ